MQCTKMPFSQSRRETSIDKKSDRIFEKFTLIFQTWIQKKYYDGYENVKISPQITDRKKHDQNTSECSGEIRVSKSVKNFGQKSLSDQDPCIFLSLTDVWPQSGVDLEYEYKKITSYIFIFEVYWFCFANILYLKIPRG